MFLCLLTGCSVSSQSTDSLQSSGRRLAALSPSRRPSSDRGKAAATVRSDTGLEAAPHEIRELLAESHHWDFDIIKLERLTERRSTLNTAEEKLISLYLGPWSGWG